MHKFNRAVINALNTVLSSTTGLYVALLVPLLVIPLPSGTRQVENILSSNWIQLWALFVLGIMAKQSADKHEEHATKLDKIIKYTKGDKEE